MPQCKSKHAGHEALIVWPCSCRFHVQLYYRAQHARDRACQAVALQQVLASGRMAARMLHRPCTVPSSCSSLMAPCQSKLTMDRRDAALLPFLRTCRSPSAKCSLSRSSSFLCSTQGHSGFRHVPAECAVSCNCTHACVLHLPRMRMSLQYLPWSSSSAWNCQL